MIKPWINILIAAIFETGWTYALKYMNFSQLKNAYQADTLMSKSVGMELVPFLAYVISGGGNIYFLSLALKDIPTSTAIAVWTAFSLVMIKICDIFIFKTATSLMEFFFMTLIIVGIIGLKNYSAS
jgi:quaternary ammonium compound-resistance protein SugE